MKHLTFKDSKQRSKYYFEVTYFIVVPCTKWIRFICCMRKPLDTYTKKQLKNLGKRIKALRKEQESNYEQFAFKNDIHRVQYGRYENGSDMKFSSLMRVLQALDISPKEFFSEGFDDLPEEDEEIS